MWVFIFVLGAVIGSFLNVCIYRIPREGMSVHSPRRSFCPACKEPIKTFDTIPLLSYLFLIGRCRRCKTGISVLYPCVELSTALLFLVMYYRFGVTLEGLLALVFVALLIPIAVIDAQHYIIPNVLIVTGLILGLVIVCRDCVSTRRCLVFADAADRCCCRSCSVLVDCRYWEENLSQDSDGWW